jgi:hypothetical protein
VLRRPRLSALLLVATSSLSSCGRGATPGPEDAAAVVPAPVACAVKPSLAAAIAVPSPAVAREGPPAHSEGGAHATDVDLSVDRWIDVSTWDPVHGVARVDVSRGAPETWKATAVYDLRAVAPDVFETPPLRRLGTVEDASCVAWWTALASAVSADATGLGSTEKDSRVGWSAREGLLFVRGTADALTCAEAVLDRLATASPPVTVVLERSDRRGPTLVLSVPAARTARAFSGVRAAYKADYEVVVGMGILYEGPIVDYAEWGTGATARRRADADGRRWIDLRVEHAAGEPDFRTLDTELAGLGTCSLEVPCVEPVRWGASLPETPGSFGVGGGEWVAHVAVEAGSDSPLWRRAERGVPDRRVQGRLSRRATGETFVATADAGPSPCTLSFDAGAAPGVGDRSCLALALDDSFPAAALVGVHATLEPCAPRAYDVVLSMAAVERTRDVRWDEFSLRRDEHGRGGERERSERLPVSRAFLATGRADLSFGSATLRFLADLGSGPEEVVLDLAFDDSGR